MALQGPFVVVADSPAPDVVDALRAAGAFPIVEADWADAAAALASVEPEGVVLAEPCSDGERAVSMRRRSPISCKAAAARSCRSSPACATTARPGPGRAGHRRRARRRRAIARRLGAAHRASARCTARCCAAWERSPRAASSCRQLPTSDPLDEATVLVAGRGRSYPDLSVAVGERVGLVGALSVESAARALNARDIDGMVIGDGFSPRIVEALLTVLAEDARFRDLPVAVLGGHPDVIEAFDTQLANLERIAEGHGRLVERFLPYVRLHAFGQRLKRMLKSLDAKGMIDPDTGLLAHEVFWRDLNRAVDDAEKRGVGLSIARFSFERSDRRISLDAARLVGRLMRQVDFACREADNSIFAVFTETDLRAAHVIARRIASVLKHTMLAPDRKRSGIETAVTLATLKPTDNVDSLIARVVGEVAAR